MAALNQPHNLFNIEHKLVKYLFPKWLAYGVNLYTFQCWRVMPLLYPHGRQFNLQRLGWIIWSFFILPHFLGNFNLHFPGFQLLFNGAVKNSNVRLERYNFQFGIVMFSSFKNSLIFEDNLCSFFIYCLLHGYNVFLITLYSNCGWLAYVRYSFKFLFPLHKFTSGLYPTLDGWLEMFPGAKLHPKS